jgi:hypothetical protein
MSVALRGQARAIAGPCEPFRGSDTLECAVIFPDDTDEHSRCSTCRKTERVADILRDLVRKCVEVANAVDEGQECWCSDDDNTPHRTRAACAAAAILKRYELEAE